MNLINFQRRKTLTDSEKLDLILTKLDKLDSSISVIDKIDFNIENIEEQIEIIKIGLMNRKKED